MKKFDIQLGAKTTQTCHVKSVFEPLPVITFIHFHLVSLIHLLLSPAAHENVLFFLIIRYHQQTRGSWESGRIGITAQKQADPSSSSDLLQQP